MPDIIKVPEESAEDGSENHIIVPTGSHEEKTAYIGADHRGYNYKQAIIEHLKANYNVIDLGTESNIRCDYPIISHSIGMRVSQAYPQAIGIGVCGSGIGILIPASKHKGVYAARCCTPEEAASSRMHNNTNVLGIGADGMTLENALATVDAWLTTPFYSDPEKEQAYFDRFVQTVKLERLARLG